MKDLLYVRYPPHSLAFPFRWCTEHKHRSSLERGCVPHPMTCASHDANAALAFAERGTADLKPAPENPHLKL